jgi:Sel1 repeat
MHVCCRPLLRLARASQIKSDDVMGLMQPLACREGDVGYPASPLAMVKYIAWHLSDLRSLLYYFNQHHVLIAISTGVRSMRVSVQPYYKMCMRAGMGALLLAFSTLTLNAPHAQTSSSDGYRAIERGDYLGALYFWRPRAEQGDAEAQFMMGWLSQYGLGLEQNFADALRWYQKAADQNFALAQANIGVMYDVGMGVDQDQHQAGLWYQKAADQGNATAQFNLGWLYQTGAGVAQNFSTAAHLYEQAARQGNGPAQFNLGILYDDGKGVTRDLDHAYMWLSLAASTLSGDGQKAAIKARDAVGQRMTHQQIAHAQTLVQGCQDSHFATC